MRNHCIITALGIAILFAASGCGGSPGVTLPGSEVNWETIGNLRHQNLSPAERDEITNKYMGKMVKWRGEVHGHGGLSDLSVKMTSDMWTTVNVFLKDAEKEKGRHLKKGDSVSFSGRIRNYLTDGSSINVDDAEFIE